tara:strand:+ start:7919 stop:8998 length:1080 start_codon:yes stop_codon:yes gene_type:complete
LKRIIVSVTNDLVTDQRVDKTCEVLSEIGFQVILVGRKLNKSLPIHRNYKIKRFRLFFNNGVLFYAEYNIRLFLFLLFSKKEILFSNDLDTLLPNYLIGKLQRKKIIFDSHELFSEIPELVHKKIVKKIWLYIERRIIPKLQNIITVSESIKNHYYNLYGVSATVIRNVPKTNEINRINLEEVTKGKKIILYQGSVNIGRGIELMIETMPLLKDYLFIVVGDGDILDNLKKKVNTLSLQRKVIFIGKKTPEELKKITPNASIGMSLEEDIGLNYRYALPNKIFDYIHGNVPIVASNLPEMKFIIEKYAIGELLKERTSKVLANIILKMTEKDYNNNLKDAVKELNWEKEKDKLIKIFKS